MIALRKSTKRGYAHHGWLESRHSFSFADYYDPAHVRFASLRVRLDGAASLDYPLAGGCRAYLHVARGSLQANGYALSAGDASTYAKNSKTKPFSNLRPA